MPTLSVVLDIPPEGIYVANMRARTGLKIVLITAVIMMIQAVILSFWCESASFFSFRVEDLTPIEKGGAAIPYPIGEFKATVPGFLVFLAIFVLALLILRRIPVTILGVSISHAVLALAIVGLTAWYLLFAGFLVVLEFKHLQPCPV